MTPQFQASDLIRDDRPKRLEAHAGCPACGGDFAGQCRRCGLAYMGAATPPNESLPPGDAGQISVPLSALTTAADPLARMTAWRQRLDPSGLLLLTPASDDAPPATWRIPKRALMLLAERAGFRLVGRGWLRKRWLFRRY